MAEGIADLSPKREDKPVAQAPKPPQTPPQPIPYEVHKKEGRHWPVIIIYGLLALIVATGVVFAGRWAYREVSNSEPSSEPAPAIKKQSAPAAAPKESSGQGSSGSGSSTNSPTPAPGPNPSQNNPSSTQLPNTGG